MAKRKIWIERRPEGDYRLHFNEPHPDGNWWRSEPSGEFGGHIGHYTDLAMTRDFGVEYLKRGQVQEIEYELTTVWERA